MYKPFLLGAKSQNEVDLFKFYIQFISRYDKDKTSSLIICSYDSFISNILNEIDSLKSYLATLKLNYEKYQKLTDPIYKEALSLILSSEDLLPAYTKFKSQDPNLTVDQVFQKQLRLYEDFLQNQVYYVEFDIKALEEELASIQSISSCPFMIHVSIPEEEDYQFNKLINLLGLIKIKGEFDEG